MDYVTDAVKPFKQDSSVLKKSLIGTLILFLSILVFPYFLYQGYLLRILEDTETGIPNKLPEWTDFGDLFVKGIVATIIGIVISLPANVIIYTPQLIGASDDVVLVTQLVGSLISLVFSYMTVGVLAVYARDGLNGVFNIGRIVGILFSLEYFIAHIALMVVGIVLGLFMFMLFIFTLGIGMILVPFIFPPINYYFMVIIGGAIAKSEGTWEEKTDDMTDEIDSDPLGRRNI